MIATAYDESFNIASKLVIEIANAAKFIVMVVGQNLENKYINFIFFDLW